MIAPWASQLAPAMAARGNVGSSAATRPGDGVAKRRVVGDQDCLRGFIVLGLGEQVDGDQARIVGGVGQHDDFGRAGDAVDADMAEYLALGLGDVGVAGADDAVDRGDAGGAVGQRGDRLGAADAVDLGDAGAARGGEDQGVEHAAGRRHAHGDACHAGDAGRHGVHQHRGWIGRLAAGDIQANRVERGPAHAQGQAGGVGEAQIGGELGAVEGLDAGGGEIERGELVGRDGGDCRVDLRRGDAQCFG